MTKMDSFLAVLAYAMKHHITGVALQDLIDLISLHCPHSLPQSKYLFNIFSIQHFPFTEKKTTFTRILVCLNDSNQEVVPSKEEKAVLKNNGLGEKVVSFENDGDSSHVNEQILG